jgi:septal ring factor EnvC (AmiA/AmiB activator)
MPQISNESSVSPSTSINVQEQLDGMNNKFNALQKELAQSRQNETNLEKRLAVLEKALKSDPGANFSGVDEAAAAAWAGVDSVLVP